MDEKYLYQNNLQKIIDEKIDIITKQNFCFWSDLLGFGNDFFDSQWNLSKEQKVKIYNRLRNAHNIFLDNTTPLMETSLILNDGLVKVSEISPERHLDIYGFFIRGCVYTHNGIKELEVKNDLPGPRSVLTFGESIEYLIPEVKLDDYVMNYTKKDPEGLSSIAQRTGNPTVVYNPTPFQMNMAFSKAYILDSLGKRKDIEGSNFFVDQSVLDFSVAIAEKLNFKIITNRENGEFTFLLDKGYGFVYWGFKFDKEITIDYNGWKTTVYRLKSFYPPDEKTSEFEQEVK